jgi:hypothetical protein
MRCGLRARRRAFPALSIFGVAATVASVISGATILANRAVLEHEQAAVLAERRRDLLGDRRHPERTYLCKWFPGSP